MNFSIIWFDVIQKGWIEIEVCLGLFNKFCNSVICIDFVKKNWIVTIGTKTQLLNHSQLLIHCKLYHIYGVRIECVN